MKALKPKQLSTEEYEICKKLKDMRLSGMAEELQKVVSDPTADLKPFKEKIQGIIEAEWNLRYTNKIGRAHV